MHTTRRELLTAGSVALGAALIGCAPSPSGRRSEARLPDEAARVGTDRPELDTEDFDIVQRGAPDARVLRQWARPVPAGVDLGAVEARLVRTMRGAGGVGLAGPQVGLGLRVAVVLHGWRGSEPRLVFARNPEIVERSDDTIEFYEACLSIAGVGGLVRRSRWVRVLDEAPDGSARVTEAEGADAVLWQHEIDHLDGVLYTDRLLGQLLPIEEMRRRREEQERRRDDKPQARADAVREPLPQRLRRLAAF